MIVVESAGITDVGRKRTGNEDSLFYDDGMGLYVVADGMGGHNAGEVASKIVADTLRDQMGRFQKNPDAEELWENDQDLSVAASRLNTSIHLANRNVYETAQKDKATKGMGSTVSAILLSEQTLVIGNVGDSPIYQIRGGEIKLVSVLHTMMAEYEAMAPDGAKNLSEKFRHMITRAMGTEESVQPDVSEIPYQKNDIFVISSDGLTDLVEPDEIRQVVLKDEVAVSCQALVDLANERGGVDNITVIVLKIVDLPGQKDAPQEPVKLEQAAEKPSPKKGLHCDIDTDDASFSATIYDLDENGAFIETNDPFAVGSEIYVTVSDPDGQNPFMLVSKVAKRRSMGIMIEFENLTDKKKDMIKAVKAKL